MEVFDIRTPFDTIFQRVAPFDFVKKVEGTVYREVKNRRTLRFELNGKGYFVKYHGPVAFREILKNLFQFKFPVLGASNEYNAIRLLEKLGIDTMTIRAYAVRGHAPCSQESFLITDELLDRITLEDFCRDWMTNPPSSRLKHALIRELASVCSKMHFAGLNHRDCYLCHFLLKKTAFETKGSLALTVLDLHRAQIHKRIPRRMRVKDLAGIVFSSMDAGLSKMDFLRFIAVYNRGGTTDASLWRVVFHTACRLYRKEFHHPAPCEMQK